MKRDTEIFNIIEAERQRQLKGMELIASENFVSDQVLEAMGSCLTNKYAEGYPGHRYYGGCINVDRSETLAIERVKELFGAEYANVQPHSGAQANAAVFLTCLNPGDTFMGLNLDHGGHLSHGSKVNTSGILYNPIGYNLKKETGRVDYDEMEQLALEHKPKLIVADLLIVVNGIMPVCARLPIRLVPFLWLIWLIRQDLLQLDYSIILLNLLI